MRRRSLAAMLFAITISALTAVSFAAPVDDEDTDTRFIKATVVEVADGHVSVMTRRGIEHVIAVEGTDTRVILGERIVSLKDLREGDVVTIELDEIKPIKFARNIEIAEQSSTQVARAKP